MSRYLVSRKEDLEKNSLEEEFSVGQEMIRYNIWKRRNWPINEIKIGDEILFFSTISRKKKLKTEVIDIKINKFESEKELKELLKNYNTDWDEEYIDEEKAKGGNLFLYKVRIIEILDEKLDIKLNMIGWERID